MVQGFLQFLIPRTLQYSIMFRICQPFNFIRVKRASCIQKTGQLSNQTFLSLLQPCFFIQLYSSVAYKLYSKNRSIGPNVSLSLYGQSCFGPNISSEGISVTIVMVVRQSTGTVVVKQVATMVSDWIMGQGAIWRTITEGSPLSLNILNQLRHL